MTVETMLRADGLAFAYPNHPVFEGLGFAWTAGLALVQGDESTGKTTLLRLMAGELEPQAGDIVLRGLSRCDGAQVYRAQVFWHDPRGTELDDVTARYWLEDPLPQRFPDWDAAALAAHVEGFALAPHLDKPFHALSTGSRRKVLMAAALASNAPLALIDEPLAGLDKPSVNHLVHALAATAQQRKRLVVVAHYEALAGIAWTQGVTLTR